MPSTTHSFFVTTPKAMENILADELKQLGVAQPQPKLSGVLFQGSLEQAYQICLWSRTASRVLLHLSEFQTFTQQDLYDGIYAIDWFEHFNPEDSFSIQFHAKRSDLINNSHFGALVCKDAIVDQMRERFGMRPSVDTHNPAVRIHVFLDRQLTQVSLDLSGHSLHQRGYRQTRVKAPIKENLAAAILLRCQWPELAAQGLPLIDPMCGSGTLLIEAAMIAADIAPGLLQHEFGFSRWKQHQPEIWNKLIDQARQRKTNGLQKLPSITGFDQDRRAIAAAFEHIEQAGLKGKIHVEKRALQDAQQPTGNIAGLIVCNPPYGERLESEQAVAKLYQQFGSMLKKHFNGWQCGLITSNPEMGFRLGIRSQKPITLFNGSLECKLLRLKINEPQFFIPKTHTAVERQDLIQQLSQECRAEMFANRLNKNLKKLSKWARQKNIDCYRLYDADLPEYAVAIDIYQNEKIWVHVQEYEAPKTIESHKADQRLAGLMAEIPKVLNIAPEQVFLKVRKKQKNRDQYEKQADLKHFHGVTEHGCQFWVNFEDYLDTGLFLDHRPMRLMIQNQAQGKDFLNLFAYTATASVHAAIGGAHSTTSVDMSNTYLEWAKKNFLLNQLSGSHQLIRADCSEWLAEQAQNPSAPRYDLIFLDPPTFSNSKRLEEAFDIQTAHVTLIQQAAKLLKPDGIMYFSTNFKKFKLDNEKLQSLKIEHITPLTVDEDFSRNSKIHFCWKIQNP